MKKITEKEKTTDKEFVPAYGDDANYARKKQQGLAEMAQRADIVAAALSILQ